MKKCFCSNEKDGLSWLRKVGGAAGKRFMVS